LRQILHAAAPCPIHIKRAMVDWMGPVLWEYYGSTEGGGTVVAPDEWEKHPGSVGRPWSGARIRITDDDRSELPPGQEGTIWISNGTRFSYHNDTVATDEAWDGDWFTVGDIGHLDQDGWLYIADRRADLVISGGVNVYPAEVESCLLMHPLVGDAAVVGLPDPEWGQRVIAVVEPRGEAPGSDELRVELDRHCREGLAGPKVPRDYFFVEHMSRNETGKVSRRRIVEELTASGLKAG
jgi:long-chain acyl-CoA synthetase